MKKPENQEPPKAADSDKKPEAKKKPAKTPAVESKPVKPGSAQKAAAAGGDKAPAPSGLVGKDSGVPAAAKKADTDSSDRLVLEKPTNDKPKADAKPEQAAKPEPEAKPAPKSTTPAPEAKKGGFWPMALGGAVAAALGAGAAIWTMPQLQGGGIDEDALKQQITAQIEANSSALRDQAVAAAKAELASQTETLSQTAGAAGAEAARQVLAEMPEGAETPAELQAAVQAQAQKIAELSDKIENIGTGGGGGSVDIAEQQAQLQQQADALRAEIQAAAAEAQAQFDSAREEAEQLQQAAEGSTRRAEAVAAIARLQSALDEGVATDEAVEQLEQAGVEAPDAVKQEVPTLQTLQQEFPAAARAALRVALREQSAAEGGGSVIRNFLRVQTGARSVEPREGDDPDAILSRADAAVKTGDLQVAIVEIGSLSEPSREADDMASWLAGAQAYLDAHAALNQLSDSAN